MSKKTKIILFSIIGLAIVIFLIAFIINANKKFIVTFDTDGGSYISSQEVKNGSYVSKPINPTKSGYEFVEWQYNNETFDFSSKVKEDMTLVAIWGKITKTYTVQLEVEGTKKTINVKEEKLIDADDLTYYEKEGYAIEWYLDGRKIDIESEAVTSNMLLTGKYVEVKVYTVTFDTDGGSAVSNQKVNENKTAKEPNEPTKNGYVFDGWYLDNEKYNFNTKIVKDISLKAKWIEDKNIKKYTVTFNSDGGSAVSSQTIVEGKKATQPKNPTKNGYTFSGWYLNGSAYNFNNTVTSNITLIARWTKDLSRYTITFNSNGGSTVSSQTIVEGNKATKPANPTRSGYTFKEWQLNGRTYDFNSSVTGSITLTAVWNALPSYTVTFNSNGGSAVSSQTIVEGNKATKPANPTRSGYTFKEWQLNGRAYDFNSLVTGSITLTAVWNAIPSYTLTINSGETYQLTETFTSSDATNKNITWSSSDSTVATVSNNGLVTAVKDGTAMITATTDNDKIATFVVIVRTPVTGVSLNSTSLLMLPQSANETESTYKNTLTATVSPSNATNKEVMWSSSNTSVVTVDSDGVVLAKKAGTATITVMTKDGNKTAEATVKVVSNELTNIYDINPTLICALTRNINNNVRAMQGVYFYKSDSTIYALYAGYQADDQPTVMTLVNLNSCSVVAKNNEQIYGHANDIAMVDNKFYVVNSNKVHGVTINNNNAIVLDENYTKMNFSFSGFEYDAANKKFYSKAGNYMYTFPSLTSPKSNYKLIGIVPNYYMNIDDGNTNIVNQGIAYGNGNIYIPRTISNSSSIYYNHSYIMVYDASTGEYKYTIHYSGSYLCHLEGMTIIDDSMYLGMNCHQSSPKNQSFLVYNGLSLLEQKYQKSKN